MRFRHDALPYSTERDFAIRYNVGRTSKTGYSTRVPLTANPKASEVLPR